MYFTFAVPSGVVFSCSGEPLEVASAGRRQQPAVCQELLDRMQFWGRRLVDGAEGLVQITVSLEGADQ